jgi:hypothetical protein
MKNIIPECSMHPTSDSWYPSFERGYEDEPEEYAECECQDCQSVPPDKKKDHYNWLWRDGGKVACFLRVYSELKENIDCEFKYIAKISFWGDDDFGLEKYFQYEDDARRFVCHLPPYISKEFLWDHGFVMV